MERRGNKLEMNCCRGLADREKSDSGGGWNTPQKRRYGGAERRVKQFFAREGDRDTGE